jgi:hypothetical protein
MQNRSKRPRKACRGIERDLVTASKYAKQVEKKNEMSDTKIEG